MLNKFCPLILSIATAIRIAKMHPAAIVNRMHEEVAKALKNPEIAQRLKSQGIELTALGPKPAQEFVNKQIDVWGAFIKANNIKATTRAFSVQSKQIWSWKSMLDDAMIVDLSVVAEIPLQEEVFIWCPKYKAR